ncbi:hypothetical protein N5923_19825 [Erwiniaceae bacterium BAC15a-03b]|uniref:Uncharacterized protein n=1 Tax=Winslowiella arboricola TaxID=2978220 RepID=A0A9J6PVL9_9GAMM|nr:hypothetical protein [Winslowiella arboricola]MCU5772465.1 hypothetical protein [Winslowiella arboricola]MCU5779741.1 hypothetical protein [Winslowiella arboricola]
MINRFTLAAIAAAFALTGCAKHSVNEPSTDFASGATVLNVTHVPARTADGATVFVTVDGNDAGALPYGESMQLHVPAGKHKVGGYARSIIGRVTIAPVEITTSGNTAKHVAYTVTKSKPNFTQLPDEPLPQAPVANVEPQPQVAEAETAKVETPAATTATPAATTETQATTTEAPAVTTETQATTTEAPAVTTETQATTTEAPAATTETQAATTEAPAATTETQAATTQPQVAQTQATGTTESAETSETPQG